MASSNSFTLPPSGCYSGRHAAGPAGTWLVYFCIFHLLADFRHIGMAVGIITRAGPVRERRRVGDNFSGKATS